VSGDRTKLLPPRTYALRAWRRSCRSSAACAARLRGTAQAPHVGARALRAHVWRRTGLALPRLGAAQWRPLLPPRRPLTPGRGQTARRTRGVSWLPSCGESGRCGGCAPASCHGCSAAMLPAKQRSQAPGGGARTRVRPRACSSAPATARQRTGGAMTHACGARVRGLRWTFCRADARPAASSSAWPRCAGGCPDGVIRASEVRAARLRTTGARRRAHSGARRAAAVVARAQRAAPHSRAHARTHAPRAWMRATPAAARVRRTTLPQRARRHTLSTLLPLSPHTLLRTTARPHALRTTPTGHVLLPLDKHLPLLIAFVGRIFMVGLAYVGARLRACVERFCSTWRRVWGLGLARFARPYAPPCCPWRALSAHLYSARDASEHYF
jgi:hypothetical protein